ncbi:MAG: hypothetical protein MR319_05255 [Mediterranea sp.]|nr:hypothetical protein [Mediterranea sp.]
MDIKIEGNPGTGNTFQEIKIGYVENYVPNATTVINNHYGDSRKAQSAADKETSKADLLVRQGEIMQYVSNLKQYVAKDWKNRYETLWHNILNLPEVSAPICEPGKQKDTTFNRNLVANIIYIMCNQGIITETNATTLTVALEGDKEHPVRAQLRKDPDDKDLKRKVESLIVNFKL